MAQAAPTVKPMYQAAMNVCEEMAAAIQERENAVAQLSGSTAVHGGSDLGATRKVNVYDWRDWLEQQREKREKKDRQKTAAKTDAFFTSAQQVQWKQRSLALKQRIQQSYERERQAERAVMTQLAAAACSYRNDYSICSRCSAAVLYAATAAGKCAGRIEGNLYREGFL